MSSKFASYEMENNLREEGRAFIAGMDEVGRGALAGPMVVAVAVLPTGCDLKLCDSKLLSRRQRNVLALQLLDQASGFGVGSVSAPEIDQLGLSKALELAATRALEHLDSPLSVLIIDGKQNIFDEDFVLSRVKADRDIACVAAASILAKVYRDEIMVGMADSFPEYGFDKHVGYGTARHIDAISRSGLTNIHRRSFKLKVSRP